MTVADSQCFTCKHYLGNYHCAAFQDGVPDEILFNEHNHREPFEGDQGIRYEMSDEEKKRREDLDEYPSERRKREEKE